MTELTKILGKSYAKLKKILRKTYDHNLAILSWPFEAQTQINTSFYAKPVRNNNNNDRLTAFDPGQPG